MLDKEFPVQADGQPWEQSPGQLDVRLRHRATMLAAANNNNALEWGWEAWEDLDYYEDLESAKSIMIDIG